MKGSSRAIKLEGQGLLISLLCIFWIILNILTGVKISAINRLTFVDQEYDVLNRVFTINDYTVIEFYFCFVH